MFQRGGGHDRGRGDVVFHLHFDGGMKIFAQTKRAPRTVGVKTDAQISGDELAVVAFQFVAGRAIDDVHAEMIAPMTVPRGLEIAFHDEDDFLDVLWNAREPGVVFWRVISVSYTHLRAHETGRNLVCRLL